MPAFALALGLFVVQFGVLIAFLRRPGRRYMRENWKPFRGRLPRWVRRVETAMLLLFWFVLFIEFTSQLGWLYGHWHPAAKIVGLEADLVDTIAAGMTAWPLAALAANAVSAIVAPIRDANRAALEGIGEVSLRRANIELIQMAVITTLINAPFVLFAASRG